MKYHFQVLAGRHQDESTGKFVGQGCESNYTTSDQELDVKFGRDKFMRLAGPPASVAREQAQAAAGSPGAVTVEDDLFGDMTIEQLKQYAKSENIALGSATKKEDILAIVRQAQSE